MRLWTLLLTLVSTTWAAECQREFFAQPVIYDRAMAIDFYYTAINLPSVAACAAFCGDRHFCRTAVYNVFAKTCAISYEYTLNCRYNEKRLKEFDTKNSTSNLIQIACVTKCNESTRIARKPKLNANEPEEVPSIPVTLKKVDIITGEPNDGVRFAPQKLARSQPHDDFTNFSDPGFINKLIIENVTRILPLLDSRHTVRRRGQICYRLKENKFLLGSAFQTHKGIDLASCRCLCAATYEKEKGAKLCKSFNWRVDGTCELNNGNDRGKYDLIEDSRYTYQYIDCDANVLMDIATRVCKNGKAVSVIPRRKPATKGTTVRTTVETTTEPSTTTEMHTTTTSEETITAEVTRVQRREEIVTEEATEATTTTEEPTTAPSTTESSTSETTTTTEATTTTEPTTEPSTTAEETPTSTTSEATTTTREETTSEATATTTETTTTSEGITVAATEATTTTEDIATTTTPEITTTSEETTTARETSSTELVTTETTPDGTTSSDISTTSEEITTTTVETTTVTEDPSTEKSVITTTEEEPTRPTEKLNIENSQCFERIEKHMMTLAAALQHDVSLEECECFCANSRNSGLHGFDCSSATYYHGERDCVLNVEDRHQKPKYFTKQAAEFNVTYLGLTCPRENAISLLVDKEKSYGCRAITKPAKKGKSKGAFSDSCFVELPSYILEGTALHVETNATPQQCKCLCAAAERKFGEVCQSFQYYYEGSTCLLSKHNRFSSPENFNFVSNSQPRSYFEYKCASKEDKLRKYTEQFCAENKSDDPPVEKKPSQNDVWNSSSEESSSTTGASSTSEDATVEVTEPTTLEPTTSTTTVSTTETTTPEETTTTTESTTTKKPKKKKRIMINRWIPETEGLNERDFDDLESDLENELEDPTPVPSKARGVKTLKFTDKIDKGAQHDDLTTTTSTTTTTTSETTTTSAEEPTEEPTTTESTTTTTQKTTTKTTPKPTTATPPASTYPPAGKCTYSALYQTAFFGQRTLKKVQVKTAADCFAACYALRCRSANLIAQGAMNECELFRDSLIDYRRPDMIGYDGSTVYFDGIRCDGV